MLGNKLLILMAFIFVLRKHLLHCILTTPRKRSFVKNPHYHSLKTIYSVSVDIYFCKHVKSIYIPGKFFSYDENYVLSSFIRPSVHASFRPSVHSSVRPSIHPSINLSIYLSFECLHCYKSRTPILNKQFQNEALSK